MQGRVFVLQTCFRLRHCLQTIRFGVSTVNTYRLGKTQPSHGVGYRKSNQIQDGGEDFPLLQFFILIFYYV